jgi:hypothetical protein
LQNKKSIPDNKPYGISKASPCLKYAADNGLNIEPVPKLKIASLNPVFRIINQFSDYEKQS